MCNCSALCQSGSQWSRTPDTQVPSACLFDVCSVAIPAALCTDQTEMHLQHINYVCVCTITCRRYIALCMRVLHLTLSTVSPYKYLHSYLVNVSCSVLQLFIVCCAYSYYCMVTDECYSPCCQHGRQSEGHRHEDNDLCDEECVWHGSRYQP